MRHHRAKSARRTLKFFALNTPNIRPPYRVLLDGNFLAASVRNKVPLHDRLTKLLQHERFVLYVTRSALDELASLPGEVFEQARQFGLDECEIIEREEDVPASPSGGGTNDGKKRNKGKKGKAATETFGAAGNHIKTLVSTNGANPRGYLVATQDDKLADALRILPHVPLLRISRGVLLLESPSTVSRRYAVQVEKTKLLHGGKATVEEQKMVELAKEEVYQERRERKEEEERMVADAHSAAFRMKRKAKGPNPLSCKKKRKLDRAPEQGGEGDGAKKKRRRKKKKGSSSAVTGGES